MSGHLLDNSTYCLWRFDEIANNVSSYEYAADATGKASFVLTQSTNTEKPFIVQGPVTGTSNLYARYFDNGDNLTVPMNVGTNAADLADVLTGSFTIETWVKPHTLATNSTIVIVGGSGESIATNVLAWWYFDLSGNQTLFWETGSAGTNRSAVQSAGDTVTLGEWQHLAVAVEDLGGTRTVSFYRNGTFQDDDFDPNAQGDLSHSTAVLRVGEEIVGGNTIHGIIGDIRISNIERSASEIETSFSASNRIHTIDANTFLHYDFNEPPLAKDLKNRIHLAPNSFTDVQSQSFSLVNDAGISRKAGSTASSLFIHPANADLAAVFSGSWTLEMWYLNEDSGDVRGVLSYTSLTVVETEERNVLAEIEFESTEFLHVIWEHGLGVNVDQTSAVASFDFNDLHHLAIVKDVSEVDGTAEMRVYIDSQLIDDTLTGLTNCTGGTSLSFNQIFTMSGNGNSVPFGGRYDDIRLSNIARTQAEISSSFASGSIPQASSDGEEVPEEPTVVFATGSFVDRNRLRITYPSIRFPKKDGTLSNT